MRNLLDVLHHDLQAESDDLVGLLRELNDADWDRPTACSPWTIKDQISHLAWNDDKTVQALVDPTTFLSEKPDSLAGIQQMVDQVIVDHHQMNPRDLVEWFMRARSGLLNTIEGADPKARLPWYGPEMSIASKVTARFMETWAHGYDVFDAVGSVHPRTDRVRHVVFLGLQAIPNTFTTCGRPIPTEAVRLELEAPSGEHWIIGRPEAVNIVWGDAYELALVVTQRINPADTTLRADGPVATEWLTIAQAFAGPPGERRAPRQIRS